MAPKEIKRIIDRYKSSLAKAGLPRFKLYLFGSYARGEARRDSDIDVCLVSKSFARQKEKYRKLATIVAYEVDPRIQVVVSDPVHFKKDRLSPLFSRIRKEAIAT